MSEHDKLAEAIKERDEARAEVEELKVEVQNGNVRYEAALVGLRQTSDQRDDARKQRNEILADRDNVRQERDQARAEVERLRSERDFEQTRSDGYKHRIVQLITERDQARVEVERLNEQLEQAIAERTPHNYGILKEEAQEMRNQRDEALAEVEERKNALIDATYQIDNYKSKFLLWFENAKTQNTKLLDALEDATKARKELEQLKQALHDARLENSGQAARFEELKHHIPDATKMIRPEPSRLEIAAMILAAVSSRRDLIEWQTKEETAWAIEQTDALIAAAKEEK